MYEAAREARKKTEEGDKLALQFLEDSQADIKKIVSQNGLPCLFISELNDTYIGCPMGPRLRSSLRYVPCNPTAVVVHLTFSQISSKCNRLRFLLTHC